MWPILEGQVMELREKLARRQSHILEELGQAKPNLENEFEYDTVGLKEYYECLRRELALIEEAITRIDAGIDPIPKKPLASLVKAALQQRFTPELHTESSACEIVLGLIPVDNN
jgi:propanediol dehydratase large subunit